MSDKLLKITLILCLGFWGYKVIDSKLINPEPTEEPQIEKALKSPQTTAASLAPAPAPAVVVKNETPVAKKSKTALPKKISAQDLAVLYQLNGIAKGSNGYMVMINNTALHEGDQLEELQVVEIMPYHVMVAYKGNTYKLAPQVL